MTSYEEVFENNRRWAEGHLEDDPEFFVRLAQEQRPDYLYIGCSDSRVPANQIMGVGPGEVFVHRNIANLVPNTDLNSSAVINYAVRHLAVEHIVVCGHYHCGGINAALQPKDLGILNPWLRNVRDVYRLHKEELNAIQNPDARNDRLVELNVIEQCTNVVKTAAVQCSYLERGAPVVHGWVFDMRAGLLKDLQFDFKQVLRDIQQIYDLTGGKSGE
ncbi:MAG: carbonic anhydrase [Armatimonadetes bacterium]|jgi:carbonic anhydrase|nr:carbonic anhydrase [Armatimonadota bacterium]